ncbi:NAD(P) transhydrogenase subunit beta [Muriicola jejuensis]|uniref:NAD(P) transhydrogenase subunit beta n=1 Tax=Muriicola jejuensis TaxID=504488 RepID=A0A6P0UG44_9FLAO|nr:NAD(P)(+) transhydrogenase (Re/Si-specific) subunit beta [Muriicola jejuensis]NER09086.1 NAD(P)(+) transhydrogenase (Re/Si-specific) subunit beta [Muriicola jejuensis]SMP11300.1 NAD(P) transhydrogenase subunit beta [Muriicola jejuensis]
MLITTVNISYLLGATAFVIGLRQMSTPATARKGNLLATLGMSIAILATLFLPINGADNNYVWIMGAMTVGGIIGYISAIKIEMTAMPQMVSVFNGLGGACAVVLAYTELFQLAEGGIIASEAQLLILLLTLLIGAVAFTGSMLAYGKLQGLVDDRKVTLPRHNLINMAILALLVVLYIYVYVSGSQPGIIWITALLLLSLLYGLSFVAPIGGADMPVVISLLNAFTGLSAAAAGLIYSNNIMMVGGILVGSAGIILTVVMCKAMNRSLTNVLVGGFGENHKSKKEKGDKQVAKEITCADLAVQLYYSNTVMVVPGYGLAVAQAQKVVKRMDNLLSANGVDVTYAIHPVAGRMPGHMNVLLAEADVPYPKLLDMEDANEAMPNTDMVIVIGANDVVNPAAYDDPASPVYGMPVINVWEAKNVVVLKRSMNPGYAGIQNQLFFHHKTRMLFGDAKTTLEELNDEIKSLEG